jgi:hypothetical protein
MAFQIAGNSGTVAEVEPNTRALRVTRRPPDVGALGSYAITGTSGTIAAGAAANSTFFSFRWSDATRVCLVRRVYCAAWDITTGFAAGVASFGVIAVRSFTVADSAQTALTLTTNNAKKRTSFGTTLVGNIMISNTAAITNGTGTADTNDFNRISVGVTATANAVFLPSTDLYSPDFAGEWPLVLLQNEGFRVRGTVPATGTWGFNCGVEWTEVASF